MKILETHFLLIKAENNISYKKAYKLEDGSAILELTGWKDPYQRISNEEFDTLLNNGIELDKENPIVQPIIQPELHKYYLAECDGIKGYVIFLESFDLSDPHFPKYKGKFYHKRTGTTNSIGYFTKLNRLATQEEINKYQNNV